MRNKRLIWFLVFLLSCLVFYMFVTNVKTTGNAIKIQAKVTKVLDGDTIVLDSGGHVRVLGVNAPEKGVLWANESTKFVKQIENKTVQIEITGKDKYNRDLGYIFYEDKMINAESLRKGFSHIYIYTEDKYSDALRQAELEARQKEIGIWKKSPNYGCLVLEKFKYLEDGKRCTNKEQVVLNNKCRSMKIYLKDDATANAKYDDIKMGIFSQNFSCVFNDAGDSLYVWDDKGLLIFERYP